MQIRDLFVKPVDRNIQGVIKVGQDADANVKQELDEYVVTRELKGHFDDFFAAYEKSINHDTDEMGVWISGFFGSGKSHFLKILSYLLEDRKVDGKSAIDYFKEKINDQMTINRIELAAQQPTDVVLFNIDSKAKTGAKSDDNAIINVFLQVFNEMQGFSSTNFWIAEMERQLVAQGKYDAFKDKFTELDNTHMDWTVGRDHAIFKKGTIKDALVQVDAYSEEDAQGLMDQLTTSYQVSIEDFSKLVAAYIKKTGKRVVFLVDEVGQFVGESTQRMLNLQTVVEDLGAATRGKAWVVVSSQQAIDTITDKISGQDFSKIQGRFATKISMSSANVDEVIRKRLLAKTEPATTQLAADYEANAAAINNMIDFDDGVDRPKFRSGEDFAATYPFVPYQFNLLQNVLTAVRTHGSDGKHLSEGARSMLSLFQESVEAIMDQQDTALVPFSLFFEGLRQFLDHTHSIVIAHAVDNDTVDPTHEEDNFNVQVLKALFMVKYLKDFDATLNNIVTLMIDSVDTDRVELQKKVQNALAILRQQRFVEKNLDNYEFLTDAEQEVNQAISREEVLPGEMEDRMGNFIFDPKTGMTNKYTYPKLKGRYNFTLNQYVDETPQGRTNNDMTIQVITSLDGANNRNEANLLLLSMDPSKHKIVVDLPSTDDYLGDLRRAEQIGKFVMLGNAHADARFNFIKEQRTAERQQLLVKARERIMTALEQADVYVAGHKIEGGKDFQGRFTDGFKMLVDNTYRSLGLIDAAKSSSDITQILDQDNELAVSTQENERAVQAVYSWLQRTMQKDKHVTLQAILNNFKAIPYGYIEDDIEWLVAKLLADGKIQANLQDQVLSPVNPAYRSQDIANFLTKKQYAEQISIQVKKDINPRYLREMKDVADQVFNKRSFSAAQPDLMVAELKEKIAKDNGTLQFFDQKNSSFPGHELLKKGSKMFSELLAINDAETFYDKINTRYDDLLQWADDMSDKGIMDFYFSDQQQTIWTRGLDDIARYKASHDFFTSTALAEDYQQLNKLLNEDRAGRVIQEIDGVHQKFVDTFAKIMDDHQKQVTDKIQAVNEKAKQRINDSSTGDDFKQQRLATLTEQIKRIMTEAEEAPDLTRLEAKPAAADAVLRRITQSLENEEQRLAEEQKLAEKERLEELARKKAAEVEKVSPKPSSDEESIKLVDPIPAPGPNPAPQPEPAAPVVIQTKYLEADQLPIEREWSISSEDDVNRYVEKLRQALLDQVKENQITKFTL